MKSDKKTRENYVGHSLHTSSVPSFNDPKPNAMWYLKDDAPHDEAAAELQRLKALENDMMLEALGLKPKGSTSAAVTKRPLKPHELGDALKRSKAEAADGGEVFASAGVGANSGTRGLALGAFGAPESIEGVDLPPEHLQRVHAAQRRDSAAVEAPRSPRSPTKGRKKSSSSRKSKKSRRRRRHDSDSESSSPRRRRRRRHDSDSDSRSSSSSRSRSRSRSPRRRH